MTDAQSRSESNQPYLWRYREGDIDTLLLSLVGEALPEEGDAYRGDRLPGETTIVTWERDGGGISPAEYQDEKPGIPEWVEVDEIHE